MVTLLIPRSTHTSVEEDTKLGLKDDVCQFCISNVPLGAQTSSYLKELPKPYQLSSLEELLVVFTMYEGCSYIRMEKTTYCSRE